MNIQSIIEYVDKVEPNNFDIDLKYQWMNDVEDFIQNKILRIRSDARLKYSSTMEAEPLAAKSYGHGIYTSYMRAMIRFANGNSAGYGAAYNEFYKNFNEIAKSYISAYNCRTRDVLAAYTDSRILTLFGDAIISGRIKLSRDKNNIKVYDGEQHIYDILRGGGRFTVTSPEHTYNITGTPFKLMINANNCSVTCTVTRGTETEVFDESRDVYIGDVVTWTAIPCAGYEIVGTTYGTVTILGNAVINVNAVPIEYELATNLVGLTLAYATDVRAGQPFMAVITPNTGNRLPNTVNVSVNGVPCSDAVYNPDNGSIYLDGEYVCGNITVFAIAVTN